MNGTTVPHGRSPAHEHHTPTTVGCFGALQEGTKIGEPRGADCHERYDIERARVHEAPHYQLLATVTIPTNQPQHGTTIPLGRNLEHPLCPCAEPIMNGTPPLPGRSPAHERHGAVAVGMLQSVAGGKQDRGGQWGRLSRELQQRAGKRMKHNTTVARCLKAPREGTRIGEANDEQIFGGGG